MNIALNTLREVANALTQPYLVSVLVLLALLLHRQNRKTTIMQKMIIGESIDSAFELTISQIVMGIFAGTIASIISAYLGIVFDESSSIDLIFLFSIVLMFISPRLVCFAYSGAILGFLSLVLSMLSVVYKDAVVNVFGTAVNMGQLDIFKIDITAMMSLIAVLHLIEGFLVIFDGKRGAIPVFTNKDNKIIGGFAIKRNWVLPVALLVLTDGKSMEYMNKAIAAPVTSWWPIVNISLSHAQLAAGVIVPIALYGVLGFNTVTFTKTKSEKTFASGISIIIYGLLLLLVAQIGRYEYIYQLLVLIFAPAAHELMLRLQKNAEAKGKPRYISSGEGLMVLEVAPKSPAFEMGIKSGDEILNINNRKINDENDLQSTLREASHFLEVKIRRTSGELLEFNYNSFNSTKRLGVVFVPKNLPKESMVVKYEGSRFQEVLNKLKNRDKDRDKDMELPPEVEELIDNALKEMEQEEELEGNIEVKENNSNDIEDNKDNKKNIDTETEESKVKKEDEK